MPRIALQSLGGALALVLLLFACGLESGSEEDATTRVPMDEAHADYVGHWEGEGMTLLIRADGHVQYRRTRGATNTNIEAPIQRFEGADFVVGFGPLTTTFQVSEPPHRESGEWRMTVDGVELVRTGDAPPAPGGSPDPDAGEGTLI